MSSATSSTASPRKKIYLVIETNSPTSVHPDVKIIGAYEDRRILEQSFETLHQSMSQNCNGREVIGERKCYGRLSLDQALIIKSETPEKHMATQIEALDRCSVPNGVGQMRENGTWKQWIVGPHYLFVLVKTTGPVVDHNFKDLPHDFVIRWWFENREDANDAALEQAYFNANTGKVREWRSMLLQRADGLDRWRVERRDRYPVQLPFVWVDVIELEVSESAWTNAESQGRR